MKDRRQDIINASLAVLRENGYSGFTQPRVAAEAGLRQSHLTYYFPTRVDLLAGVARVAVDRLLAAVDGVVGASSVREAAKAMANVAVRHENTRVIMALVQAADQEPALRELFRELADGVILRAGKLLRNLNIEPTDEHCYQLHSMSVGMAVVDLATSRKDGERRAARTLETALTFNDERKTMMKVTNSNVLIAGAGPVGLAMAADLARYGVSVRLIEKSPERTDKSKALVLWSRTLELMDRMDCTAPFLTTGKKVTAVNITAGKEPITKITVDGVRTPHPYALMMPQCDTEELLGFFLTSLGVKIERNIELTDFVASADGVTSTLRHLDGTEETFESGWLIGSDGAHSTVRHKLGMEFSGETMPSSWVIADVHLSNVPNPEEISIAWHAEGILAVFPIQGSRYRVIADSGLTNAGAAAADPTVEDVQSILDVRGPGGITVSEPIWLTRFSINERKVANYRSGRVFVMGDAAHIHSPAGGQGMNTGMQDAFNLAWKLAMVSRGLGDEETLLGSYSAERSPIADGVLKAAGRGTEVALMRGEFKQSVRNHITSFIFGLSPVKRKMADVLTEVSIGYPQSPLNGGCEYAGGGPKEGERAPVDVNYGCVGAGDTPRFALFADGGDGRGSALIAKYSDLLEPSLRAPFEPDGLWLVRPDGYVALATRPGRWNEVERYLEVVTQGREN